MLALALHVSAPYNSSLLHESQHVHCVFLEQTVRVRVCMQPFSFLLSDTTSNNLLNASQSIMWTEFLLAAPAMLAKVILGPLHINGAHSSCADLPHLDIVPLLNANACFSATVNILLSRILFHCGCNCIYECRSIFVLFNYLALPDICRCGTNKNQCSCKSCPNTNAGRKSFRGAFAAGRINPS